MYMYMYTYIYIYTIHTEVRVRVSQKSSKQTMIENDRHPRTNPLWFQPPLQQHHEWHREWIDWSRKVHNKLKQKCQCAHKLKNQVGLDGTSHFNKHAFLLLKSYFDYSKVQLESKVQEATDERTYENDWRGD